MKVKQLKKILAKIPDDYEVYVWAEQKEDFEHLVDYCPGNVLSKDEMWVKDDCLECEDQGPEWDDDGEENVMFDIGRCSGCRYKGLTENALVLYGG